MSAIRLQEFQAVQKVCERFRMALEDIALLDEADGHELTVKQALEAVAIATSTLGRHPSEILAERHRRSVQPQEAKNERT